MAGRVHVPVNKYNIETFSVDYLDMITEPGPNKILFEGTDRILISSMKSR